MLAPVATYFLATLAIGLGASESHARTLPRPRASVCNGYSELCSRSFGNVTLVGAHDSYAVGAGNIAANQDYNATQQLTDGIRMLQVQAHNASDGIHLCHTSCALLDGGSFESYLTPVKSWLDANPNEVIAILIVNSDDLPPTSYSSIYESVGLDALSYSPSSSSLASTAWPSLGDMIDQGKRVVTFMDYEADFTQVPYIIDEFSNVWETAYDVTDQTFNCELNRTGTPDNKMYLINHFLDKNENILGTSFPVPNKDLLNVTNGVSGTGSLGLQAEQCGSEWGKYPSFMLVDFYDWGSTSGSVFQVAATLNGVTYSPSTPVSPPITATTTTGATSPTASYHKNAAAPRSAMGINTLLGAPAGAPVRELVGATLMPAVMLVLSWASATAAIL